MTQQTITSLLVVFTEANEYSGTPKCACYVATMNACEGSGYTLELQCGAHQVAPLDTFATAGREGIAAMLTCYRHMLAQHASLWPYVSMATQQSTPWDATPSPRCTSDSIIGTGGAGG